MNETQYTNKIIKLSNQVHRMFYTVFQSNGSQSRILYFILMNYSKRSICQKDVQKELNIQAATVSGLLKKMEKQGLIIREKKADDDRIKIIYPSDSIIKRKEDICRELNRIEDRLVCGISKRELELFNNVLEKMIKNSSYYSGAEKTKLSILCSIF